MNRKDESPVIRLIGSAVIASCGLLLVGSAAPALQSPEPAPQVAPAQAPTPVPTPEPPKPPSPPTVQQALADGVLIVVSLPTQKLFVFKDGEAWGSAPVSTGRRGHSTPTGVFPILQKAVHHRSNLYSNAPMPYMQRLTRGGIALHAGKLPGYRASHGCIRLPWAFAKKLYGITSFASTAVLVTHERLPTAETAFQLASGVPAAPAQALAVASPKPVPTPAAAAGPKPAATAAVSAASQTIQLAALANPQSADRLWQELLHQRPELAGLERQIVPATVNSRKVFRLRASGPAAHAICRSLASSGVACLKVAQNGALGASPA
jgi:hypothetical protein